MPLRHNNARSRTSGAASPTSKETDLNPIDASPHPALPAIRPAPCCGSAMIRTGRAATVCLIAIYLHGCAGAVVAGAAAGASMAADRRTATAIVDDQSIELKAS